MALDDPMDKLEELEAVSGTKVRPRSRNLCMLQLCKTR